MLNRITLALREMSSGDLSCFGGPIMNEDVAGRVRAEQISVIMQDLPWMMLANASNAIILVVALRTLDMETGRTALVVAGVFLRPAFGYVFVNPRLGSKFTQSDR